MFERKKIAIIICYFGKLPWYFDYFIHTCKYNPSIDFFIIKDDNEFTNDVPTNIKLINKSLNQFNSIATQKLGFKVDVKNPYKLCDFKPAYGLLFSELIEGYDIWGYGDIDVIFGNIRNFMTDEILDKHDIISVRHDFLTGYFQLFKNNEKMVNLFTRSKDYNEVFSNGKNFCFDETNYHHAEFTENIPYKEINSEIESMMHVVCKMAEGNEINPYFDFHVIEGLPGKLKWSNGSLFYRNKYEVMLHHLIKFKTINNFANMRKPIPSEFRISTTRIY